MTDKTDSKEREALRTIAEWPITKTGQFDAMDAVNMAAVAKEALAASAGSEPNTHVQKPAEIEHVAGDVSKTGAESNMAQQPAPSAAAAQWWRSRADEIEAQVAATGSSEAMRCYTDMRTLLQAATNPPSPTPQADSQPAPVRDERDDFEKVSPLPSGCIRVGTGYASTGYSNWAAHTHVERWRGWQARAARAPADSVLEDAARLDWLQANSCDLRCIGVPTGGDDYDINWVVIEHYQAKPHEREIGRSFQDDPRGAIDAARKQGGA